MKAQGIRHIKSGLEYNQYFTKAAQGVIDLPKSDVFQTLQLMSQLVFSTLEQTVAISGVLKGISLNQTCQNIFDFVYNHIQYKPDEQGVEQLRTPNRAWTDRKTGVDCDCYSIFISSILTNLQIPHGFRMTKYDGKSNFQHVYVIVPKNGKTTSTRKSYYVIDPVLDTYNNEKTFSENYDIMMKIPHQILNGAYDTPSKTSFGQEFDHLSGLGNVDDDFLASTQAHLENTLDQLNRNSKAFSTVVDPETFKEQLEYVLENWHDPVAREGALEEMAEMEDLGENEAETIVQENGINGLGYAYRQPLIVRKRKAKISVQGGRKKVKLLRQRRKQQKRVVPATIQRGTLKTDKKFNATCSCHMVNGLAGYYSVSLHGLDGLGGFFKKIGKAIKKTVKKVGSTVKKVAKKTVEVAKKVGKAIVRYNPLTIAARGGLLLVMKINLFGIAKKVKYGYLSEAQARAKNMNMTEWRKVKDTISKMEKLFTTVGGKADNLRNAILKGKAGGLNGLGAAATAASTAAASSLVATIAAWLKKINFKKLFNTAKTVVSTAQKVKQSFAKPKIVAMTTPTYTPSVDTTQENEAIAQNYTLPQHTVVAEKPKKSNMGLMIGVAAAGVAAMLLLGKKKGKSLNGVIESISI